MTEPQSPKGEPSHKILGRRSVKLRLALAGGLVLSVGAWLAPAPHQTSLSLPQEHAAPLLEEQVQQRQASTRAFVGVQDAAAVARRYAVAIPPRAAPAADTASDFLAPQRETAAAAGFGVFVSDRHVLAHADALDGRSVIHLSAADGQSANARVTVYEPATGLVLLETETGIGVPAPMTDAIPAPGMLAVAVGGSPNGHLAIPVFITETADTRYTIGVLGEPFNFSAPIFTVDGELLAIASADGSRRRAHRAREATGRLFARAIDGAQRSSFGVRVQALTGLLAEAFGGAGVVITEVVPGGPAEVAGIEAGDVLLRIGDTPVESVGTALQALSSRPPGASTPIRIRRAGVARTIDVVPMLAYEAAARARAAGDGPTGPEARAVFPETILERASIPADARVVSINGRAVASRAQSVRALRASNGPARVLLRHGADTLFVAVAPAP